jgi:hypothetical protein
MKKGTGLKTIIFSMLLISVISYAGGVNVSVTEKIKKDRKNTKNEDDHTTVRTSISKQQSTLNITVSNLSKESATVELEWYFFERNIIKKGRKGDFVVSEKGTESISLEPKKKIKKTITSKEYQKKEVKTEKNKSNKHDDSGSNKTYKGTTYGGYVVLLRKDGKIISKRSSESKLLTKEWLKKLSQ